MHKYEQCHWYNVNDFKIIKMIGIEDEDKYYQCDEQINFQDFYDFVKRYIKENNIKMTGQEHHLHGIPLIKHKRIMYSFLLSYADWEKLIAEAYEE